MKPWTGTQTGLSHWARFAFVGALALGAASQSAWAQFYFRPFGHAFHQPIEDEPRFASRGAVARIVAHEGFRLVGPLGERGDQIVATGVDERGRRVRFVIDPYEGEVLGSQPMAALRRADEGAPLARSPIMPEVQGGRLANTAPVDKTAPAPKIAPAPKAAPAPAPKAAVRTEQRPATGAEERTPATSGSSHRAISPPRPVPTTTTVAPAPSAAPAAAAAPTTTTVAPAPSAAPAAAATPAVAAESRSILPPIATNSPLLDVTHTERTRKETAQQRTPKAAPAAKPGAGG